MSGLAPEVSILALSLGLTFALVCYLVTNLSPGGMITPGWIALVLITDPSLTLVIGLVAVATYAISRLLQRFVILYGKRLFATVVLVGVFLQASFFVVARNAASETLDYTTLGFIIPGLIAYQLIRQPILATLISTAAVTSLAYLVVLVGVSLRLVESRGAPGGLAAEDVAGSSAISADPLQVLIVCAVLAVGTGALIRSLRRVERLGPTRKPAADPEAVHRS